MSLISNCSCFSYIYTEYFRTYLNVYKCVQTLITFKMDTGQVYNAFFNEIKGTKVTCKNCHSVFLYFHYIFYTVKLVLIFNSEFLKKKVYL